MQHLPGSWQWRAGARRLLLAVVFQWNVPVAHQRRYSAPIRYLVFH
jgi:hypothetical protein